MSFVGNLTISALLSEEKILGYDLNQFDKTLYADFNTNATHNNYTAEEMKDAKQKNRSRLSNSDDAAKTSREENKEKEGEEDDDDADDDDDEEEDEEDDDLRIAGDEEPEIGLGSVSGSRGSSRKRKSPSVEDEFLQEYLNTVKSSKTQVPHYRHQQPVSVDMAEYLRNDILVWTPHILFNNAFQQQRKS
jgi:hypothetical protein